MIKTWAGTDTGLVRKENQDTYRIARNGDICVVCDGMGGAAGGRLASTLASETYAAEMEKALKPDMTPEQLREASAYAVAMANRAVAERAEAEAALANMGTTLVAAVAYENGVVITTGAAYADAVPAGAPASGSAVTLTLTVDGKSVTTPAVLANGNYYLPASFYGTLGVTPAA